MEIILVIWGIGIVYCVIEAIFFTEIDPESRKFIKERDRLRNEEAKKK